MMPLAVPPEAAAQMLGIKPSKLYELLRAGELSSFSCGRARRVVVQSIINYIERRVADARASGWQTWQHNPRARQERAARTEQRESQPA
jgi:excisionase family DNA binding protein